MNISTRISVSMVTTSGIAALAIMLILATLSINSIGTASLQSVTNQLASIKETKASEVTHYFQSLEQQLEQWASSPAVISNTKNIHYSFELVEPTPEQDSALKNWYQSTYSPYYAEQAGALATDPMELLEQLDPIARFWQFLYIADNPNPMDQKSSLLESQEYSMYNMSHKAAHVELRKLRENLGVGDIYIVDSGNDYVTYSVTKNIAFGTSLTSGPFSESGLAKAYQSALQLEKGQVAFADFSMFTPSYESSAAFIASPIYNIDQLIGVLVFQMDRQSVDQLMTYNQRWKEVGLGTTGEVYLVGPDGSLRTGSREFIEAPNSFQQDVSDLQLEQSQTKQILAGHTTGLLHVSPTVATALTDQSSDFAETSNYLGKSTYTSFRPLSVFGQNWQVVADLSKQEADFASQQLIDRTLLISTITLVAIIVLAVFIGLFTGRRLARPILYISKELHHITTHKDLAHRIALNRNDELGQAANSVNELLDGVAKTIKQLAGGIGTMQQASTQSANVANQVSENVEQQSEQIALAATAMSEMVGSVSEIAQQASSSHDLASKITEQAQNGSRQSETMSGNIVALADEVENSVADLSRLESLGKEIVSILDVIQGIAEQTNLLALNAAIEAARAGEQGRGFAVVADEVRALANRTHNSTEQIQQTISKLQSATSDTVQRLQQCNNLALNGRTAALETVEVLNHVLSSANALIDAAANVAAATEEQATVSEKINQNIQIVQDKAGSTKTVIKDANEASQHLSALSDNIKKAIEEFKV
ncbi:methyl-accepting chemotaxis protein [Rhodanobacter aciditrophus]|uniref:Methyl-accepting chemotaxis protein n=1 Tax=Rhodanobacter aciditrophus TaxID=1623218 RepID=A0ABW4AVI9_9GAMM